jgi:hypothetical protein
MKSTVLYLYIHSLLYVLPMCCVCPPLRHAGKTILSVAQGASTSSRCTRSLCSSSIMRAVLHLALLASAAAWITPPVLHPTNALQQLRSALPRLASSIDAVAEVAVPLEVAAAMPIVVQESTLTAEAKATIVNYMNTNNAADVSTYVLGKSSALYANLHAVALSEPSKQTRSPSVQICCIAYTDMGKECAKANAFSQGSFVLESATLLSLDGRSMRIK